MTMTFRRGVSELEGGASCVDFRDEEGVCGFEILTFVLLYPGIALASLLGNTFSNRPSMGISLRPFTAFSRIDVQFEKVAAT